MFSANLTFDKIVMMQFWYFFLQKSPFWVYKCDSKLNLNTFALSCCVAARWWIALHHHS